jgi:hypothetical protein
MSIQAATDDRMVVASLADLTIALASANSTFFKSDLTCLCTILTGPFSSLHSYLCVGFRANEVSTYVVGGGGGMIY